MKPKRNAKKILDLWRVPAYLPYLQPKLTPARLKDAEKQLGVKLPKSYVALLEKQNGGYVRLKLPESVHSMIWGIGPHFPNIARELGDGESFPKNPKALVPFDGDGHWYLCFDYRKNGPKSEPSIAFVDVELESERKIAKSFDAFLALLEADTDPCTFGLVDITLDAVAKLLTRLLKVRFDRGSSFGHGYTTRRAALGKKGDPEWIWITPNEAPRGFARSSEPRYKELSKLLPGSAFRFPDHPEVGVVVQTTDGVFERVRKECTKAGLKPVALDR